MPKGKPVTGKRNTYSIVCKICNKECSSVGFHTHLLDSHGLRIDEYVLQYGEYRKNKIIKSQRPIVTVCRICGREFISEKLLSYHIRLEHGIQDKEQYIREYVFKNEKQYCECGCGNEIKLLGQPPYRRKYISGHNPNGMIGKHHSIATKKKQSIRAIDRVLITDKYNTGIELQFKEFLDSLQIDYIQQYKTEYGSIDFYIPSKNQYIEIDGEYWHPIKKEGLNFQLISNLISDYKKNKLPNLIRIYGQDINKLKEYSDIEKYNSYSNNIEIGYRQKLIKKEYFSAYKDIKGEKKLRQKASLLLKFIRELEIEFPIEEYNYTGTELSLINKIVNSINVVDNTFSDNISTAGVKYLKSRFKSYWNSAYNNNPTPRDIWYDDDIMLKIIEYRIGLNNSNEVFDFSLHQLVRGISALRYTISFFKPVLAGQIYKSLLGNRDTVTVLDPCAGFGGRLLGFKSMYPNGTYIGIEPNIDTYQELCNIRDELNLTNVLLYNCTWEYYNINNHVYDIIFTSIPYYTRERYSNIIHYNSFSEWTELFFNKFIGLRDCYIEIDNKLFTDLQLPDSSIYCKIEKNKSHFNKNKDTAGIVISL